ncbi:MAG: 2-oxoacid:acceptor oxidoreductase subunit alpha [Polyangia bacterium]|jgi:2-oxoglutarate ferredoxin oxidoreductase subunit alpha|nr:2-oxoacid:acceptor oxidoreductase subunit alpha [Polyangia bacterium]
MHSAEGSVLTGTHFIDGDVACAEGAIAAGCRFSAGYPITPSTEVVERLASRFPLVGGMFVQMEDELASSIAIIGAAWGGVKSMTVSSGPGISLMQEHIGYAAITETPSVWVNVQRGGPSTGLPTLPGQADMMQARWGSHGDYPMIALCPNSPQEAFDLTVVAFNLAEDYRTPVLLMLDEAVGHMLEKVVIPPAEQIEVRPRRYTRKPPSDYKAYECEQGSLVPDMAPAGKGYYFHVTGLTHDERGYPAMNAMEQDRLIRRLKEKVDRDADGPLRMVESSHLEGAQVLVVSYGITSRVAERAILEARAGGLKVGHLRLLTVWPFPEQLIRDLLDQGTIEHVVVPELNLGQVVLEVERVVSGRATVRRVSHAGGTVHEPKVILEAIEEVRR